METVRALDRQRGEHKERVEVLKESETGELEKLEKGLHV